MDSPNSPDINDSTVKVGTMNFPHYFVHYDNHLMFLDISEDGHMLLGAGDLSGRYWSSSIYYSKEAKTSLNKENSRTTQDMENVLCCGKILESGKKIVVGDDVGKIFLASVKVEENDSFVLNMLVGAADHDSAVLALSLSPDKKKLVSGGIDMCIKVWDVSESLSTLFTYRPAHSKMVTDVAYSPNSDTVFASCSHDGSAVLWDTRQITKPALALKRECEERLEAGCWLGENVFAVGSAYGNIMLIDTRMKAILGQAECFKQKTGSRPLHKLVSNSNGLLAACGDTNEVKVFETSSECLKQIYTSASHDDFVRGLAWHPKTSHLYSCGFDSTVKCHDISKS